MDHSVGPMARRRSAGSVIRLLAGDEARPRPKDGDRKKPATGFGAASLGRKLRDLILDGSLRPGERLPSSRTLARDLKCARGTIETSYCDLESEGLIERRRGDGSYVAQSLEQLMVPASQAPAQARRQAEDRRQDRLADPAGNPVGSGLSARGSGMTSVPACAHPLDARSFGAGIPDLREFPWSVWRRLWMDCLRADPDASCGYSHPQGLEPLRAALARWLRITRGIKCERDRILILHSSQQALALSAMLLFDAGDRVAVEDPGYPGAYAAFATMGVRTAAIPVDRDGVASDALIHDPTLAGVYLTPSYQNPTGGTLSLQRRLDLIRWAQTHNAWIIEDDYGGGLTYDHTPIAALAGLDPNGRTLYIGTASKLLFPGLRIAWMVLPDVLVDPFTAYRANTDGHTSAVMQMCLARFIDEGHMARHNRRMTQIYRARREVLVAEIEAMNEALARPVMRIRPSNAGLKIVVDLLPPLRDTDVAKRARNQGLDLPALSSASGVPGAVATPEAGRIPHNGFILGFSGMTPDEIRDQAQRLRDVMSACIAG